MKKKQLPEGKYLSLAFFFVGLVVVIIASSFIWKGVELLGESTFDGTHQFILATRVPQSSNLNIAVFTPAEKTVALFTVSGNLNTNTVFPVPFDGKDTVASTDSSSADALLKSMLFPKNNNSSGLGIVDSYKLFMFSKAANKTVTSIQIQNQDTDLKKKYSKAFLDKDLYQEAKSLAIINATGKAGFGNDISQMLSMIGCNVISVGGAGDTQPQTTIQFTGERGYTLSRMERIFKVAGTKSTNPSPLADITVIIGEDYLPK